MDNQEQIKEIMRYREHLSELTHTDIDLNTAALIWVRKYAQIWRLHHNISGSNLH